MSDADKPQPPTPAQRDFRRSMQIGVGVAVIVLSVTSGFVWLVRYMNLG